MKKFLENYGYLINSIVLFIMAIALILDFISIKEEYPEVTVVPENIEFLVSENPKEDLINVLQYYDIQYPEIVYAQAILETGNFKSYNCIINNNLFGLYNSRTKSYYKFDHWSESVLFYKKYIQYKYNGDIDYYEFLDKLGYAEDPEYINKVKAIVKRNNSK